MRKMTPREAGALGQENAQKEIARLKQERIDKYNQNPTLCGNCKKPFIYEKRKNKYCNSSCAAKINNAHYPKRRGSYAKKPCLHCGKITTKPIYCSMECGKIYRFEDVVRRWLNDEIVSINERVPHQIRNYLLEQNNYKCSNCGWGEINQTTGRYPLNIDHINGKPTDHNKNNLRVLCPNCHSLTPNYGSLNKGNGRQKRYKYRDES